uniref:hypothetical protein n=1 Tax=Paenibacillus sp. 598K TaxID=1117987 RepID=UPI0021A99815|nr:hypothetical protein [Paenibacillus sp. 598K]
MSAPTFDYQTYQVWIKPGHRLFSYLHEACQQARNLYNTANFYIRQVFTAKGQSAACQPLQQQVMATLSAYLDTMNARRRAKNRSRPFEFPTPAQRFLTYPFLDGLFKVMEQPDYRSLPAQSSQGILKVVFQNLTAFFASFLVMDSLWLNGSSPLRWKSPSRCRTQLLLNVGWPLTWR